MFDGVPVDKLTAPLLLLLAVLMVLMGLLVPRWTYKRLERERDDWKLAFEVERESRLALQEQTKELLELAKTTNNVLTATFGNPERPHGTGGNQWEYGGAIRRPLKRRGKLSQLLNSLF
jgi:hypothetical protein